MMSSTTHTKPLPDQRVLLAVLVSYTAWLLLTQTLVGFGIIIGIIVLLQMLFSPAPRNVFRRWFGALPAALVIAVVFWLFAPVNGPVLFSIWGKSFTQDGLARGVFFAVRFLGLVLGGLFLYTTSTPEKLARATLWFCAPLRVFRVPVHLLYYIVWFAMRSAPVVAGEAQLIKLAQQARGLQFSGKIQARLYGTLSMIIPVFAAAARRSDRFALALQARGFDPARQYRSRAKTGLHLIDGYWLAGLLLGWLVFLLWSRGTI
jgi:energy-coupling factor transport system permease protein